MCRTIFYRITLLAVMLSWRIDANAENCDDGEILYSLGVTGVFDINYPGKATSTRTVSSPEFGYGCAAGLTNRLLFPSNIFFELGGTLSIDDLRIYEPDEDEINKTITKFSTDIPLNAGWQFELSENFNLSIIGSIKASFTIAGSINDSEATSHVSLLGKNGVWKRANISAGFGFGISTGNVCVETIGYLGLKNMVKNRTYFNQNIINDNVIKISFTFYFLSHRTKRTD